VSGYIDTKAISLLKTKGIVSGNMWLEFPSGEKKQMQIKNIPHETKIVTKNKTTNQIKTHKVCEIFTNKTMIYMNS
jgi:hypothetical protein